MSDNSHIEWTDATWNPTTGCTKVSEGCRHCYIDRTPLFRIGIPKPRGGGEPIPPRRFDSEEIGAKTGVMLHPERLEQPLRWKRPRRIFVNSLSDLFHDDVPAAFISEVFTVMAEASQHQFQVLTKRPRRMASLVSMFFKDSEPPPNVWLGTSVEDQKAAELRIPLLLETPAAVRFLSCEPLLGPVDLTPWTWCDQPTNQIRYHSTFCRRYRGHDGPCDYMAGLPTLDWVIAGGESGPKARPMHPAWVRSLRDQCHDAIPFFFKQWGEYQPGWFGGKEVFVQLDGTVWKGRQLDVYGVEEPCAVMRRLGKKNAGRELDERTWDEMPDVTSAESYSGNVT